MSFFAVMEQLCILTVLVFSSIPVMKFHKSIHQKKSACKNWQNPNIVSNLMNDQCPGFDNVRWLYKMISLQELVEEYLELLCTTFATSSGPSISSK